MNILRNAYDWIVALLSPGLRIKRISNKEARELLDKRLGDIGEPLDTAEVHPAGISTFDPNSDRAKKGLAFQTEVFEELKKRYPGNNTFEETWDHFKRQNPKLTVYELACLEKEWGDITFVHDEQRFWIECCFAMGKKSSWFCEMKRIKFKGVNKFYCWGKINEPGKMWFIPSRQWNSYVKKCDKVKQGRKTFRIVPKHLIGDNIRVAKRGVDEFVSFIA
jgi:hypothetical protein